MTYSFEIILDIAVLALLLVMIAYCFVLNKRLKAFRNIKQEMADIIDQLNASTSHAQKSIVEFKNVVFEEEKKLGVKLREASEMADELDMINQTGSNLADRIEKGLTGDNKAVETPSDVSGQEEPIVSGKSNNTDEKFSLSSLDKEDAGAENLRENLRNVR